MKMHMSKKITVNLVIHSAGKFYDLIIQLYDKFVNRFKKYYLFCQKLLLFIKNCYIINEIYSLFNEVIYIRHLENQRSGRHAVIAARAVKRSFERHKEKTVLCVLWFFSPRITYFLT